MISDRVKRTKAFQEIGGKLPALVWEDIVDIAALNKVDLNTVKKHGDSVYEIGEPRTKLTITATPAFAKMTC